MAPPLMPPVRFAEDVPVTTAQDMYDAVTGHFDQTDILVMAAAVQITAPPPWQPDKVKKSDGR